jgi:ferrochelatase
VEVCTWHDHPGYVTATAGTVNEAIARLPAEHRGRALVVFSAHGLPMSQVRKGDPYPEYVQISAQQTAARCNLTDWHVTYQSRVGPTKWLGPDTMEFIEQHARGRAVVTVPIAFVSEHLETLYDLDILAKDAAEKGGAIAYARAPALGTRPDFIRALADIVRTGIVGQPRAA